MDAATHKLGLVGYGAWPVAGRAAGLVATLEAAGIRRLVDVRLSPCSSDAVAGRPYGPKAWNLQPAGAGIVEILAGEGIAYEWLVELGNPQRQDPTMSVLRGHLADESSDWPVHRGLKRLAEIVRRGEPAAILCACGDGRRCHRTVVARALSERHFGGDLDYAELPIAGRRRRTD